MGKQVNTKCPGCGQFRGRAHRCVTAKAPRRSPTPVPQTLPQPVDADEIAETRRRHINVATAVHNVESGLTGDQSARANAETVFGEIEWRA